MFGAVATVSRATVHVSTQQRAVASDQGVILLDQYEIKESDPLIPGDQG
jgi:hypothetical protein